MCSVFITQFKHVSRVSRALVYPELYVFMHRYRLILTIS